MHTDVPAYTPRFHAQHSDLTLRGLRHRIHAWGDPGAPPLFLLHGWVDTGMSFQFLADHLADRWRLIAPDWRGFGDSAWDPNGYWFPDYLADLEALLAEFSPGVPVPIVGHSMGGNVACLYAGIRPGRISHLVSLDSAGLKDCHADEAPARYARWLGQLRDPATFTSFADQTAAMALVLKLAPELDAPKAEFLAQQWARLGADHQLHLPHDPRHKHVNPVLYRRDEARACWRLITAPTLFVLARESHTFKRWESELRSDMTGCIRHLRVEKLDCGHMMHLEKPEELAELLNSFLSA
jgi:pimeloyl-ACP methyl ester carboxylesterase